MNRTIRDHISPCKLSPALYLSCSSIFLSIQRSTSNSIQSTAINPILFDNIHAIYCSTFCPHRQSRHSSEKKKNAKKTATSPRIPASGTQDVFLESPPYFLSINRSQPADKAQVSNSIHNNKIPTNSILCCVSAHESHDQLQHHIIVKILFALWLYRCFTYASGEHIAQCTSSAICSTSSHQNKPPKYPTNK